eukprot:365318-Chlamydomonas_euryale.AAC.5
MKFYRNPTSGLHKEPKFRPTRGEGGSQYGATPMQGQAHRSKEGCLAACMPAGPSAESNA